MLLAVFVLTRETAPLFADGHFNKVRYLVATEDKPKEIEGELVSDTQTHEVRFEVGSRPMFSVNFDMIKAIHYEKASKPRYGMGLILAWPLLFTKSKKHYLTIQYIDKSGKGKYETLRLDKNNFRSVLETLEADSGVKVDRTEER